jgi:hypothetical protein
MSAGSEGRLAFVKCNSGFHGLGKRLALGRRDIVSIHLDAEMTGWCVLKDALFWQVQVLSG